MKRVDPSKPAGGFEAQKAASEPEPKSTRDFLNIASLSTALAFGCVAATVESLRGDRSGFSFQISVGTFAAFVVGAVVAIIYWRLALRNSFAARSASFLLALAGIGAFLYPLRFVPSERLPEVAIGLGTATCAISIVVWLLWRVKRFLDADSDRFGPGGSRP